MIEPSCTAAITKHGDVEIKVWTRPGNWKEIADLWMYLFVSEQDIFENVIITLHVSVWGGVWDMADFEDK